VAAAGGGQSWLATSAEHWNPAAWESRWWSSSGFATRSASPRWNRTRRSLAGRGCRSCRWRPCLGGPSRDALRRPRCFAWPVRDEATLLRWHNRRFLPTIGPSGLPCFARLAAEAQDVSCLNRGYARSPTTADPVRLGITHVLPFLTTLSVEVRLRTFEGQVRPQQWKARQCSEVSASSTTRVV